MHDLMMPAFLPGLLIALAFIALAGVVFEEVIHLNKAKTTLFLGTLGWMLMFALSQGETHERILEALQENIGDIAGLWLFLMAAMTFVVYLNKKGMIEKIIYWLLPANISERALLFITGGFAFVFSSLADNITATLVSIALVLSLNLPIRNTLRFATLVVFAVNSGGVALITGDVTTLMIFLAGKVSITDLLMLSVPSLIAVIVLAILLSIPLKGKVAIETREIDVRPVDRVIALVFFLTIVSTIAGNVLFGIPPVLSFLFGLSLMFLLAHFFNEDIENDPVLDYIRHIEFDTLLFFLGILLLVGMLKEVHALDALLNMYQFMPTAVANYSMGLLSAAIDNVPLTAALLKSGVNMPLADWMCLTYAVGVGGSLLIIGSAAGIVAMSKVKELTMAAYFRLIIPLMIAYSIGYGCVFALGHYVIK
ncbi:sodium:proton antiporter NhaD [Paraneptunicella aestuarii]|uniref:sodium:proton antiporter NhaD n=1 Tax=Paraneptunicella aestuarii TaxID=2831148 RepID=UPI001E44B65B|nr:sodium:proton antiporter NhaD [Paraneptunicella aestuarii]